jgi:hypothetical protein
VCANRFSHVKLAAFGPDPPLAKPCVSASSLRADPDCRALRLLLLTLFAEEPPRSDLSPLRGSSPSLSVSAVGVFDADTQLASLALRLGHLPDPLAGPLGRRATCGGRGGLSANISSASIPSANILLRCDPREATEARL